MCRTNIALQRQDIPAQVCSESSYYRIDGGQCAQICLGSKVGFCPTSMVTSMGKLTGGTCGKLGYAAAGKTMVKGAGPCGRLEFDLFEKSTVVGPTVVVQG